MVRAYVKRLMRDGFPQEFFIEGGRSRTGKVQSPKLGLLSMEVDAWLAPFRRFWSARVDALERHLDRMEQAPLRKGKRR